MFSGIKLENGWTVSANVILIFYGGSGKFKRKENTERLPAKLQFSFPIQTVPIRHKLVSALYLQIDRYR